MIQIDIFDQILSLDFLRQFILKLKPAVIPALLKLIFFPIFPILRIRPLPFFYQIRQFLTPVIFPIFILSVFDSCHSLSAQTGLRPSSFLLNSGIFATDVGN